MQERDFVSYEYRTITVKMKDQARAMDMYEAFGWEITTVTPAVFDGVTLSLRRDRKQRHKQELNKLERQAEDLALTIDSLERSKVLGANIFAYAFGAIAVLILGGGMSMAMLIGGVPAFVGGIVLGIVGIALCGVNYPVYKRIAAKKTSQVLPAIDDNEEKLASVLEKGNDLLRADII